jgi:cysteinyl-tRNA synthetase
VAMMEAAAGGSEEHEQRFLDAMNDDLNAPQALAIAWELLKSDKSDAAKKSSLLNMDGVLGLGLKDIPPLVVPAEVQTLIEERERVRQDKDFAKADDIRQRIKELGFTVDDTELGPVAKIILSINTHN